MWPIRYITRAQFAAYKHSLSIVLAIGLLAPPTPLYSATFIVQFNLPAQANAEQLTTLELQPLSTAVGAPVTHLRRGSGGNQILQVDGNFDTSQKRQIATILTGLPSIELAEVNVHYQPYYLPNDPLLNSQWYLTEPASGINAEVAWDISRGIHTNVVAVVDSGVRQHADLASQLLPGYDFISNPDRANDGSGRDNDPTDTGDFLTQTEIDDPTLPFPSDSCAVRSTSSWHGTSVAGVVAAVSDNNLGITGVDHRTKVLPVRAFGKCGGTTADIIDAIRWAAGINDSALPNINPNPADVINLSFGAQTECSAFEQAAINDAVEAGAVVVVAAGNSNEPAADYSPASCNNVITVGASSRQGGKATYSNFGSNISLSAPGGNASNTITDDILVLSNTGLTTPDADAYVYSNGTSFATPMVSATASLLLSVNQSLTPADIKALLESSTRSFPTGTTDGSGDCQAGTCGSGLLDTAVVLSAASANALGGGGSGEIRMIQETACVTEDDNQLSIQIERLNGTGTISARVETQRISALPNVDFTALDEIVTWQDGTLGAIPLTVAISSDAVTEGAEFFSIRITNKSVNARLTEPDKTQVTLVSTNGSTRKSCGLNPPSSGGGAWSAWTLLLMLLLLRRSLANLWIRSYPPKSKLS